MWSTNDQTNSKIIVTNREGKEVNFVGITEIEVDFREFLLVRREQNA